MKLESLLGGSNKGAELYIFVHLKESLSLFKNIRFHRATSFRRDINGSVRRRMDTSQPVKFTELNLGFNRAKEVAAMWLSRHKILTSGN